MTNVRKIGWALVGLGRHADRYLAPGITASVNGKLHAVCSRRPGVAEDFADRHGAARAYSDLDRVLGDPDVEAVLLASPNFVHPQQVKAAAQAGKHVLCEKPLAPTAALCADMVEDCARAAVKLGVGFHLRHSAVHIEAGRRLQAGDIGELRLIEGEYLHRTSGEGARSDPSWRADPALAGGGAFMGTGVHIVDLVRMIAADDIAEVTAISDGPDGAEAGGEDLVSCVGRLAGGATLALCGGRIAHPVNQLRMLGSAGTIICHGSIGNYGGGVLDIVSAKGARTVKLPPADLYRVQCEAFAGWLCGGEEFAASGIDGLRCAEVTEAIYRAARCGRRVNVARGSVQFVSERER